MRLKKKAQSGHLRSIMDWYMNRIYVDQISMVSAQLLYNWDV